MIQRKNYKENSLAPIIIIMVFSLMPLFNFSEKMTSLAGLVSILGFVYYFVSKRMHKLSRSESGLDEKMIIEGIKKNWLIVIAPIMLNLICIVLSKLMLPEYFEHVIGRVDSILALDKMVILTIQFLLLAFLEEVVWRALIQKRLTHYIKGSYAIALASIFFALAHASAGNTVIVIYDLVFIFGNSIFYGLVFHKTKNAYVSTFSHFIANVSGMMMLLFLV